MKFTINNCNRFGQFKFALHNDDRFSEHTHGKEQAVILYAAIETQISLSQSTYDNGDSTYYDEEKKEIFCILTEDMADEDFGITKTVFKQRKKFLKDAGLISYQKQKVKRRGVATVFFITDFTEWVKQNGLYVNGEWHVTPSSENYFNPNKHNSDEKIVKVAPKIKKQQESVVESVEVEQEPTEDIVEKTTEDFTNGVPDFNESVKTEVATERPFIEPPKPKIIQVVVPKRKSRIS
ncbi:hypothetical protein [Streptomyces sp. ID01-9D]|uniref:hypothetical protein n=1 Tax=Streptomyces sp. ID01-9D TaxID=3028659 RepID=UPI0029C2F8FC|nr:hypothetical protein [Streptomyces sp. ID01-9D]MDX5578364.1 hypothetical protein [Streptomyces sp. ID01-9D]